MSIYKKGSIIQPYQKIQPCQMRKIIHKNKKVLKTLTERKNDKDPTYHKGLTQKE